MKKLMIAAAAAAMIGGTYANTCVKDDCGASVAGTAHKVTISLKSLKLKNKTIKVDCEDPECKYWFEQGSTKICGLIWQYLDECTGCTASFEGQQASFWTDNASLPLEFGIAVGYIGKPDKNNATKKVQAYGMMTGEYGEMAWAGFGSLASKTTKIECEDDECSMWVKSISGNIAGRIQKPEYVEICAPCEEMTYDGCCDLNCAFAAAYGTIKIAYDSGTAKKVALAGDGAEIGDFYKLPKGVKASEAADNTAEVIIEE